jgi:hypothetical protein
MAVKQPTPSSLCIDDLWRETEVEAPLPGMTILAELNDCKICKYCFLTIKEGEGLGHIKRWAPLRR